MSKHGGSYVPSLSYNRICNFSRNEKEMVGGCMVDDSHWVSQGGIYLITV